MRTILTVLFAVSHFSCLPFSCSHGLLLPTSLFVCAHLYIALLNSCHDGLDAVTATGAASLSPRLSNQCCSSRGAPDSCPERRGCGYRARHCAWRRRDA